MTKFKRNSSEPYTLITPLSSLADLEEFLKTNIFALGRNCLLPDIQTLTEKSLLVTDYDRKFVLGLATSQDLENFVSRRGL